MDRDEIIQLLQIAAAYDNRRIDEIAIRAWSEAGRRARWSLTAAAEAIHEHYAHSTAYAMPGHLSDRIRATRAQPAPVADTIGTPNPALDGLPIPTDGAPAWAAYDVNDAITRSCDRCHAEPDQACMNPISRQAQRFPCLVRMTGKPYLGKRLDFGDAA